MHWCRGRLKQLVVSVSCNYYRIEIYCLANVLIVISSVINITCHGI